MMMGLVIYCLYKKNRTIKKMLLVICGNDKNIVQMKGTGQFLCEAACDEDDDED